MKPLYLCLARSRLSRARQEETHWPPGRVPGPDVRTRERVFNARLALAVVLAIGLSAQGSRAQQSDPWGALQAARNVTGPNSAQDPAQSQVQVTVRAAQVQARRIAVPVNQGVLVDFSVPVREVRVANAEIADATPTSPRQILVRGKSYGSTQLLATVEGGNQETFTIMVDLDLERLRADLKAAVPRAAVQVTGVLEAVVLSGTVPDVESAEKIVQIAQLYSPQVINHLRVAGVYQVLLRCTVAEVNRAATRRLGFNGWMAGDDFQDAFVVSQIGGINPVDISAASKASAVGRIPFATGEMSVAPATTLTIGFPRVQMQVFIQALRENGLLQVLAEPNLVTISGQEASFLAGGEFPIPVPQRDGAVTIEFRQFGVRLNFTPTVLSADVIRLRVTPEVSEPDFSTAVKIGGFAVPGLIQRRVETVVELGPGQTFAIGGLLSERSRAISSKIPGLGDLPVLGALFSSVDYQSSESELVVLVTPELVAPLNPDQIAYVPGTDHLTPSDWELFGLGQIEGRPDPAPSQPNQTSPGQPTHGPAAMAPQHAPVPATLRLHGPVGPAAGDEEIGIDFKRQGPGSPS